MLRKGYIGLILLPFLGWVLPVPFLDGAGLLAVLIYSLCYGRGGGLFAAVWSALVTTVMYILQSSIPLELHLAGIIMFFPVAWGTGWAMDYARRKQLAFEEMEDQLRYLGMHDPLTKIDNRAYFELESERLEKARPDSVGVLVCDVDGLKLINDTLGHEAGDKILVLACNLLKEVVGDQGSISRIDGDEFVILLPNLDQTGVEEISRGIRESEAHHNQHNTELSLSISMGSAVTRQPNLNIHQLFKEADNNMYREKLHRFHSTRSTLVQTVTSMMKARDLVTEDHALRLMDLITWLARLLGMSERSITEMSLFAEFHDIGKVGIPDRILFKEGVLTPPEIRQMQRHCEIGYRIARSSRDLTAIADWILKHHEWWNGTGYPLGLKGEEIPFECRVLAVVDAYDAMTNDRPYRKAFTHREALGELRRCAGVQFDPFVVERFAAMLESEGKIHMFPDRGPVAIKSDRKTEIPGF